MSVTAAILLGLGVVLVLAFLVIAVWGYPKDGSF